MEIRRKAETLAYASRLKSLYKFLIVFSSLTDYVYFETSSSLPYQIRRIEELNKAPSGNVEAKVMCFYRRRDLPISLVQLADKHQSKLGCVATTNMLLILFAAF